MTRRRYATPEEAFEARTEPIVGDPDCLIWTGALDGGGYGRLHVNGRMVPAHRYAWERERGPIPDGLYVDHRCYVRSCVNVDHLRLATPQENQQNRSGARKGRVHDLPRGVNRRAPEYTRPEVSVGRFNGAPVVTLTAARRSICIRPEDARDIVTGVADVIAWLEATEDR